MWEWERLRGELCLHTPRELRNSVPLNAHPAGRELQMDSSPPFSFRFYGADPAGEKDILWALISWIDAAF